MKSPLLTCLVLVLLKESFAGWLPDPTLTEEDIKSQVEREKNNVSDVFDGCSQYTDCNSCATASYLFTSCRWCPLFGDNSCHMVGSEYNTCNSTEQITDESECMVKPDSRSPVILMPGLIGSNLEAMLENKPDPVNLLCATNSDWYTLWLSASEMLPYYVECLLDNLQLVYDGEMDVSDMEGVTTRIPGSRDNADAIDCTIPGAATCSKTKNWYDIIRSLQANGYVFGQDLWSFAYDYRTGPKQWISGDFPELKNLTEAAYEATGKKVWFTSISMGGPYTQLFFTQTPGVDQAWKDKYVAGWASMSGVFGGVPMITHTITSGMNMYVSWVEPIQFANAFDAWPSFAMLIPRDAYNGSDPTYVTVQEDDLVTASYTWSQVNELLTASGRDAAADMVTWMNAAGYDTTVDPMVNNTYCWFTSNMATEESYVYNTSDLRNDPEVRYGVGDTVGTVASLDACKLWDPTRTTVEEFENITHAGYMSDETIVAMMVDLFTS